MTRRILTAALAAVVLIPAFAAGQERTRAREGRMTPLTRPKVQVWSFNRARLGVTVNTEANPDTDRYGARIQGVVPDGPADEAGIKAGDIITRFNSTSLGGTKPEGHDEEEISGPGLKLVELAAELENGDTVRIEYRRDGSNHTATIVAGEIEAQFAMGHMMPSMEALPRMGVPGGQFKFFGDGPGNMEMWHDGPGAMTLFTRGHGGLDLTELDSNLGEYFGTTEGLLVVKAPADSAIPLRAGDVILSIDGRKPTSAAHAMRIIGSYDEGETVKVDIMRKRQRSSVEWKVDHSMPRVRSTRPGRVMMPLPSKTPAPERVRL